MVKSHPILYDTSHGHYNNKEERQKVWNKIGKQMNVTPDSVKTKYKNMKDSYLKCVRRGTTKYKYQDLMEFVDTSGVDKYSAPASCAVEKILNVSPHSHNEDTLLIDAVKCRPLLYNREAVAVEIRKAIWEEVAENLNRSGELRNIKNKLRPTFILKI